MSGLHLNAATLQRYSTNNEKEGIQYWEEFDTVNSENDNSKEADVPQDKTYIESYIVDQATGVKNVTSTVAHCLQYRDHNINTHIYGDNVRIGGSGGSPLNVNINANTKTRITWIRVHAQPHSIRSIEIHYLKFKDFKTYNPRYYRCGIPGGESRQYYFRFGECITQLRYWGNNKCGGHGRFMKIEFRTNYGGHFEIGQTIGHPYVPIIGSGIPGGMLSKCGHDVDAFALLLYK